MIEWHDVQFPTDVSEGSRGGPEFKTRVFETHEGREQRNMDWRTPRMRYNVSYGIRTDEQMQRVIEFFNARRGRATAFRYRDWNNYLVLNDAVAVGDGESRRLPLRRFYGILGARSYRRIRCVVKGSIQNLNWGGVTYAEGLDYNIDYLSGEIAFNDPVPYGELVRVDRMEFDEPVRFDVDNIMPVIEAYNNNALRDLSLVGIRDTFSQGTVIPPNWSGARQDALYDYTTLILSIESTNNLTSASDRSAANNTLTFNGSAVKDPTEFPFGAASISFGDTGSVSCPGAAFDISKRPFTMETFVRKPTAGVSRQPIISLWKRDTGDRSFMLRYHGNDQTLRFYVSTDGSDTVQLLTAVWSVSALGAFDHVEISRDYNDRWALRINGQVKDSRLFTDTLNFSVPPSLILGQSSDPTALEEPFQGRLGPTRVTIGRVRNPGIQNAEVPVAFG